MEASTQEGRFLVVPATFPGRQEHFTVCDRSSMRFLLQHLWAAITSQVPPSGLCRWCCWKVCWSDPWQSSIAQALIHKYRTQDIAETIVILWKIQPRAGHSPSVHWKELTLFKIHLCHSSEIFFKENASQQFFIRNWRKKKKHASLFQSCFHSCEDAGFVHCIVRKGTKVWGVETLSCSPLNHPLASPLSDETFEVMVS